MCSFKCKQVLKTPLILCDSLGFMKEIKPKDNKQDNCKDIITQIFNNDYETMKTNLLEYRKLLGYDLQCCTRICKWVMVASFLFPIFAEMSNLLDT